jgi:hypothetical protein
MTGATRWALDHERREMSETRESANVDYVADNLAFDEGYRLRQGGRKHSFSRKCGSESHIFVKKIK